jgi:hypothetical protein
VTGFNTFLQSAAGTGWRELRTTWLTLPTFEVPRLRSLVHHQGRWIVVGANSLIGTLE